MNRLIISIITFLLMTVSAIAQTVTVHGSVTDTYGPVIGATVPFTVTDIWTITDMDGNLSLSTVATLAQALLLVRYVGRDEV